MDRPVDKFILRLQENGCDPRETSPGEWLSRCPSHEDNNPSLSVGIGDNGGVIFNCHAKCSSTDVVYALGLSMSELFPERANRIPGNARIRSKPAGKKTAEYEYRDAEGVLVYKTVRRELPEGGKTFSQMRPNGQGGWINSVKGIERVLYRLPELIAADKSATVYVCYSPDTEVLTPSGWVAFPLLDDNSKVAQYDSENGNITFVNPTARQVFEYNGEMLNIASTWCDLLVTPDHRMLVKYSTCAQRTIVARDMSPSLCIPTSGVCHFGEEEISPDAARMLACFIADGHWPTIGTTISWNLKKTRKQKRIRLLLSSLKITHRELHYPSTPEWIDFRISKESICNILRFTDGKKIKWDILNWPLESRVAFLNELRHWDGDSHEDKSSRFFTSERNNAEVVSALAAISGFGCGVRCHNRPLRKNSSPEFILNLNARRWRQFTKYPEKIHYSGKVYCCTVDTGFLIVRRNGKTCVSGNCEGEKKVEALRKWGLIATCNVGGAGKWSPKYSKFLAGRTVIILPDNDPVDPNTGRCPGMDHARKVIESLAGVAASVKILALPDLPSKGDIVDWQEAGHGLPEFMQLVEALQSGPDETQKIVAAVEDKGKAAVAAKRDPVSTAFEEAILAEVGLDVLGELEDSGGKVKVFSSHHRKTDVISDTAKLTYERLLQICGPGIKAKVFTGKDEVPEGMHRMADIRHAIALASGFRRVTDDSEVGRGIWQGIGNDGEPNKTVVLVGAGEAARWNGDKILHRVLVPRSEGRILDLGSSEPWFDHTGLSEFLTSAESDDWCVSVVEEATELFARWRWKFQEETPSLIVGLLLANWVQTVFAWRPMVAIAGDSNTGKSTLFMALSGLFGSLTLKSSDSSAAALRQKIGRSAPVVMCDEFENSQHREEILKMLRSASRGDKVLRGTTGNQKGKEFSLRHIVWTAATESGLKAEPDINRFIVCDLIPPPESEFGKLTLPPAGELGNLGQRLLAVAVRRVIDARNLAVQLKAVHYEGRHPRVIENYSVPAAMLATAAGMSFEDATGVLGRLLAVAGKMEILNDKQRLIDAILESQIDCGHGERATVAQAMSWHLDPKYDESLERYGIRLFQREDAHREIESVFVVHSAVSRMLLKQTEWERLSIDQILMRLPGAKRSRQRIGDSNPRGILIPIESLGIESKEGF